MKKELKKVVVFWVGGERDGEILKEFDNNGDAIGFAVDFEKAHETEFDPLCGGVGIEDEYTDGTRDFVEW